KAVSAASWPVIVINNKDIYRNITFMIFPGYFQYLLLIVITQFALPESKSILWHHGYLSCGITVLLFYFCRSISNSDPIIHLYCAVCSPLCGVCSKRNTADSGIMPQKSISQAGYIEENRCLRITVCQLQIASL